jgi:hypothetical protein
MTKLYLIKIKEKFNRLKGLLFFIMITLGLAYAISVSTYEKNKIERIQSERIICELLEKAVK